MSGDPDKSLGGDKNINKNENESPEPNAQIRRGREVNSSRPSQLNLGSNPSQLVRRIVNRRENPSYYLYDNIEHPPNQETVNEANALYLLMLSEQMRDLGLELNRLGNIRWIRPGYRNARSLRTLAEHFAQSPQRNWVHEQAMNVDLDSLNFLTFQQLLSGLFEEGGVTWERVLVLFYFCTDISVRAFQEKFINYFLEIYNWTVVFLSGRFSLWIDAQGGWSAVLQNSISYLTKASILAACCVAIAISFMYFRKR